MIVLLRYALFASAITIAGCSGAPSMHPVPSAPASARAPEPAATMSQETSADAAGDVVWAKETRSPGERAQEAALDAALYAICGTSDASLAGIAARGAKAHLDGSQTASDELPFVLRAAGEPHVWPRTLQVVGSDLDEEDLKARFNDWIAPWKSVGSRRCGIGRAEGGGSQAVYAVAVDALADLGPVPTTARVGEWISLEAKMLVPATDAHVVLLGPHGAPKTIIASLSKAGVVKSRFAVDQEGPWLAQILATVGTGPRPVLEAMVFAGVAPPKRFTSSPAPGESAAQGATGDDDAMIRMINAARASEQLSALKRDPALDALAKKHSEEMLAARMVGHDVGSGDPAARAHAAGYTAHVIGENVASAGSLEAAHRALWSSPSHRGNLLLDRFTKVGVAVVRAADGQVWVTELFAG